MFTGLIESVGKLQSMEKRADGARIKITCPSWDPCLELGESIAVQGVCLTVTKFDATSFEADVLNETLVRSNLHQSKPGQRVNLERALRLGDKMGGHFVTGHVDATGVIAAIKVTDDDHRVTVRCERKLLAGMVAKGSVALDGISLTIASLDVLTFDVCIIPWTWKHTSLHERQVGDFINVETDMLGKYVHRYLEAASGGVSEQLLAKAGFMDH